MDSGRESGPIRSISNRVRPWAKTRQILSKCLKNFKLFRDKYTDTDIQRETPDGHTESLGGIRK